MQRTSRETTVYPITIRELEVLRVQELTPGMRRIVLGGAGLEEHERNGVSIPAFRSTGFDDDIKIIVPDPVTGLCPIPQPQPGGTVAWTEDAVALARTYTVRSFDPETGELAIDFVLHGTGLASSWSRTVRPGESIYVAGPKVSAALPTDTDWMLLVGDDTALPAIARCLEDVPAGTRVRAVVEIPTVHDQQELDTQAELEVTWVIRDAGDDLVETVKEIEWWEGNPFVWVAGEATDIKPLRRWFKQDRSVPREHTDISGYWRRREVISVENDAHTLDVAATGPSAEAKLHELTELAPALAIRTACAMDLFAHVDDGADTVAELAERTGTQPEGLTRLLRLLAVHDLLNLSSTEVEKDSAESSSVEDERLQGGRVELTEMGQLLADPDSRMVRSLNRSATIAELSLAGLYEALTKGGPVAVDHQGRSWAEVCAQDSGVAEEVAEQVAEEAWFTAPALPGVVGLGEQETVTFTGPGAGVYADEALRRVAGLRAAVAGSGPELQRRTAEISPERREQVQALIVESDFQRVVAEGTTTAVAVDPFGSQPAPQSTALLSALLREAERVIVVSALVDADAPDEFDAEEDVRRLCLHGGLLPTRRRLAQLAADAGGIVVKSNAVGWGLWAIELAAMKSGRRL
ncbi:siderophore-interacting protein [Kocuria sp.]|uniref:siderophore-interacting protein n=1 Tax=Kocuria sp. TaxID=1871328 RepID=UPI0026DF9637|nr:siderophore-interacting protein [Kocuria sp.]MDO5618419.1 siderophore-interacting protein [Kocuria sp.]